MTSLTVTNIVGSIISDDFSTTKESDNVHIYYIYVRQALVTFLDAVKDGLSIAACVSRVQDQVLQKVFHFDFVISYSECFSCTRPSHSKGCGMCSVKQLNKFTIPHISYTRHNRRWCTFFKPAYPFPQRTGKGLLPAKFIQRL